MKAYDREGTMRLPSRRGRVQRVFRATGRTGPSITPKSWPHNAATARQRFDRRRDQVVDREQPCEQDSAVREPRPKSEPSPQFAIGYLLLAILKR
jgi:hypothetical protein